MWGHSHFHQAKTVHHTLLHPRRGAKSHWEGQVPRSNHHQQLVMEPPYWQYLQEGQQYHGFPPKEFVIMSSFHQGWYKTFVRPQVEYAATVWDPHAQNNIQKIEAAQRRAARFVTNNNNTTSSVTAMMEQLQWESLQQRRMRAKVVMTYRILHSLVAIPSSPYCHHLGAATRGHSYRYRVPYSRTTIHKESFIPSAIRLWNQLPDGVTSTESLESFKTGIQAVIISP